MIQIQELSDGNYYIHVSIGLEEVRFDFEGTFARVDSSDAGPKENGFSLLIKDKV